MKTSSCEIIIFLVKKKVKEVEIISIARAFFLLIDGKLPISFQSSQGYRFSEIGGKTLSPTFGECESEFCVKREWNLSSVLDSLSTRIHLA